MNMELIVFIEVAGAVAFALGLPAIILGYKRRMKQLALEEKALELRARELSLQESQVRRIQD